MAEEKKPPPEDDQPHPPIAELAFWKDGMGRDPSRYLLHPGSVKMSDTGKVTTTPGNLHEVRPYIINGKKLFVFPVGPEGFRRSGQAQLGLHRPIGHDEVRGVTVHRREARIELSGMFPGTSAQSNMVNCDDILASSQTNGLSLWVPGVFDAEQFVLPESWDFTHDAEDRTHSISYTITFIRVGYGQKIPEKHGAPGQQGPIIRRKPKGKPHKIFTVKAGYHTFRSIAKRVYGSQKSWQKLVKLNAGQIHKWEKKYHSIPSHKMPTHRWPTGTKFRY